MERRATAASWGSGMSACCSRNLQEILQDLHNSYRPHSHNIVHVQFNANYTVSQKTSHFVVRSNFNNIDGFSKFLHWYILWKICNNAITKYPTTPELRSYTTLWNTNFQKSL